MLLPQLFLGSHWLNEPFSADVGTLPQTRNRPQLRDLTTERLARRVVPLTPLLSLPLSHLEPPLLFFLGGPPDAMPARYRAASPVAYARAGRPAALLVYGGRDHLVEPRFGRQMAAALRRGGTPVAHVELPWAEHGFDFARGGVGARTADALAARFLARVW